MNFLILLSFSWQGLAEISFTAEGAVKVGEATDSCASATEGALRWSGGDSCMQVCNGAIWQCVSVAVCGDTLPDTISFTSLIGQATSTQVTSNIDQVTGIVGCVVEVTISGEGSPEYRTCSDSSCSSIVQDWTSAKGSINNNEYLQVRMTTASAGGVQRVANLVVGSRNANFSTTTTGSCTDANPPLGTICADDSVYVGMSPDGNVKMYTTRCRAGRTWDGSNCSGGTIELKWANGETINNPGLTDFNTGEANTSAIAALSNADGPYEAADYCDSLTIHGQSDWYLPARNEASVLVGACGVLLDTNCSDNNEQWTSNEDGVATSAVFRFSGAVFGGRGKTSRRRVRCVRK